MLAVFMQTHGTLGTGPRAHKNTTCPHHTGLVPCASPAYLVSPAHPHEVSLPLWGTEKRHEKRQRKV